VIVVDASVIVEILPATPAAGRIGTRLFAAGETLHAPHLIDFEVAQALGAIRSLRSSIRRVVWRLSKTSRRFA